MNIPMALDTIERPEFTDSRFTVPGMRCAGCIAKIERGLQEVEGVEAARVNFSAKRVAVRHDKAMDADGLVAALGKLGFEAQAAEAKEAVLKTFKFVWA